MNKDFTSKKLNEFQTQKKIKVLLDLAKYIETHQQQISSNSFIKLSKYHDYLINDLDSNIQKLNKEFRKIKEIDYQFQIYLMSLERLFGVTSSEYEFLVRTNDKITEIKKKPIICILDSIRSAHNVGAIIRSAECFGVKKVYLTGLSPHFDHPQVIKTAMGTIDHIDLEYKESAIELVSKLKQEKYKIISLETGQNAININEYRHFESPCALIVGHEQFGISLELLKLSDDLVSIPMHGLKNSLNVSNAMAIALNHFSQFY